MANQSPDRRQVLEMLARVAAVSQFPGFCHWVSAAEHHHESAETPTQPRPAHYQPLFFTAAEYSAVDHISELIIPNDGTPGARDAGVSEFIDFMVAHDNDLQAPFRRGLAWLNEKSAKNGGQPFTSLTADRQQAILRQLAYRKQQSPDEADGQKFFNLIRRYTVMGYYTSRLGLEQLDYPGLKLYSASPECPHKDDPEHRHLQPARS